MGCSWNRLNEPIFMAVSFFGMTGILYSEKFYALCLTMAAVVKIASRKESDTYLHAQSLETYA